MDRLKKLLDEILTEELDQITISGPKKKIGDGDEHAIRKVRIRPVLIIQNDIGNKHSPTTIIAPITSIQKKTYLPTHVFMGTDILPKDSYILLEHIRAIDKTRLRNFIGRIEAPTIKKVNQAICISLDIKKEET